MKAKTVLMTMGDGEGESGDRVLSRYRGAEVVLLDDIDLCCETGLGLVYSRRRLGANVMVTVVVRVSDSGGGRRVSTVTAGVGVPANAW